LVGSLHVSDEIEFRTVSANPPEERPIRPWMKAPLWVGVGSGGGVEREGEGGCGDVTVLAGSAEGEASTGAGAMAVT
jgi:hypothetical protein